MIATQKATYGLVSRTIINVIARDEITREKLSIFSLYMHWAIIMGYPGSMTIKKQLIFDMLQRLAEQYPQESTEENTQRLKTLLADQKNLILEIYLNSKADAVEPALQWSKDWQQHCAAIFLADPSPDTCFQLFFILKDSLTFDSNEQYSFAFLINEIMRNDTEAN
jgi:hypothetical protein